MNVARREGGERKKKWENGPPFAWLKLDSKVRRAAGLGIQERGGGQGRPACAPAAPPPGLALGARAAHTG